MTETLESRRSRTASALIVTADDVLAEQLAAIADLVGAETRRCHSPDDAVSVWPSAPFVLLGVDQAAAVQRLPRRSGVVLVTADNDDAGVWARAATVGADFVAVLPDAEPWLPDVLRPFVTAPRQSGLVVAVAGGRGGAGSSSLAVALALSGARSGMRSLLVDLDDEGGGLDLVLGMEDVAGVRWPGLLGLRGTVDPGAVMDAVPVADRTSGRLHLVSGDRSPAEPSAEAVAALLDSVASSVDLTVLDIGRARGPAIEAAFARTGRCLLVVPRETRAAVAGARVLHRLQQTVATVDLVVRGPAPAGLTADAVGEMVGLRPVASLRPEPGLAVALDHGDPPAPGGPLADFADRWLAGVLPAATRTAA